MAALRAIADPYLFINNTSIRIEDSVDGVVIPKQSSEYFAQAVHGSSGRIVNARAVMLGSNSFDGLETYYLPYESNPLTHKLPK